MQIQRLHPDTIEEVKQRTDIYDVVSEYVVLRKRGKDFVGLCPFHNEKTPSFTVSQTKQMYYCFGCHAAGNAIKFLMELEKTSFSEVVLDLARRYQVPVKTLEFEQTQELQRQLSLREQLYEVLALVGQFYQHAIKQPQGKQALNYLISDRQLSDQTIQQFGLGYAPPGWETLYRYLVDNKRYPAQLVEQAGLIKPRKEGGGYYDVFRDRLMIPIHDIMGRVIGFGGRTLGEDQPKYLNSPETELFHKGKTLFALDKAKTGISQMDGAVVVEGYFDAIALHAAGINNVVASLGTAFSAEQARLVLRYTDSKLIVFNFDADAAGINATEKAIGEIAELAYKGEVKLKILNIPDGKDADEYLQVHTPEDYHQLLTKAPLWLDWQIQKIIKDKDLKQATDFQQVSQGLVKILKNIGNSDTRSYYVSHCAEILSLGDTKLVPLRIENLLTQISSTTSYEQSKPTYIKKPQPVTSPQKATSAEGNLLEVAEGLLLQIYLHCPEYRESIFNSLEEKDLQFSLSHHRFLWQQILEILDKPEYDLLSIVQDRCLEFPEEMDSLSHLFHLNEKTQKDILRIPLVIQDAMACIEIVIREKRYRHFLKLWQQTNPETEEWQFYYQAFYKEQQLCEQLYQKRQSLKELLGMGESGDW
ncbi:DNA primase [Calothrix rhizosoleniae]|uniref:DNA primase n=1 Tax=Calothrix rhizosoleniae TaxID=888997 RepID=UPI000B496EDE|nr:DNA primase [Calothrix rhizosoleniae]